MQISKSAIIETTAALSPFLVSQFGAANLVWPTAAAAVAGVYLYNRATVPGYAPVAPGHRIPAAVLLAGFVASVYLAKQNPGYAVAAGVVFAVGARLTHNYFYAQE